MATVFKRGGKANRAGYWYCQWYDHHGKRKTRCTHTTDKAAAERIAAKFEAETALRRDGVIDPALDAVTRESQRTIAEHLADYEAKLRTAGRDEKHVTSTVGYVRLICKRSEFARARDIAADAVNRFAGELRDKRKSARTIQAYLTAIKGFTKWLAANHKLPRDPLAAVRKPNPATDRRRERRMLLPDEWVWLESTIFAECRVRNGMPARDQALLYALAIETGLRSSELRSLTRGRLFLDGAQPFVTCKAGSTKNGREARQFVQRETAEGLRTLVATKTPRATIFAMPECEDVAEMLRADLTAARRHWFDAAKHDPEERLRREQSDFLADVNHEGERLDFHALRHTCGAWLAMTGAHPKAVQAIMRHSAITLTMDTHGHLFPGQEADAVARVADLLPKRSTAHAATGTHGREDHQRVESAQQLGRVSVRRDATASETSAERSSPTDERKSLRLAPLNDTGRRDASPCESASSQTRTENPLIKSQIVTLSP